MKLWQVLLFQTGNKDLNTAVFYIDSCFNKFHVWLYGTVWHQLNYRTQSFRALKRVYLSYFTKYALNFEIWGISMHLHVYMNSETWNINWQPLRGIKSKYLTVNLKHVGVENDDGYNTRVFHFFWHSNTWYIYCAILFSQFYLVTFNFLYTCIPICNDSDKILFCNCPFMDCWVITVANHSFVSPTEPPLCHRLLMIESK